MSKTKWIWVLVIIIVLLGLWWKGVFNGILGQQAAVVTSQTNTEAGQSSAAIKSDVARIVAQVNLAATPLGTAPTREQISAAAASISTANALIRALAIKFQAIAANSKTTGKPAPDARALADLQNQVINGSSQAGTAAINATAKNSTPASLKVSASQIISAQTALKVAIVDIQTILQGLGVK